MYSSLIAFTFLKKIILNIFTPYMFFVEVTKSTIFYYYDIINIIKSVCCCCCHQTQTVKKNPIHLSNIFLLSILSMYITKSYY